MQSKLQCLSEYIIHSRILYDKRAFDATKKFSFKIKLKGFPGGSVIKNPSANAGDMGSIPGLWRSHMPRSDETGVPQLLSLCVATTEARGP